MFDSIHWTEKCAETIFNLEVTLSRLKMDYTLEREKLLGEICCLRKQLSAAKHALEQVIHIPVYEDEL